MRSAARAKFTSGSSTAYHELSNIFNSFIALYDPSDSLRPMLVRQIPTQDNGDWVVNADGTMLTTYRLRENARWHDGAPVTAEDFVFAYEIYIDPTLPITVRDPENLMLAVDAVDQRTFQIRWKQPYFRANGLSEQALVPCQGTFWRKNIAPTRPASRTSRSSRPPGWARGHSSLKNGSRA